MKKGFCRLCRNEKLLCKKSHILPAHTYNILKEDGHSIYIDHYTIKKESKQKDYSGKFESDILCQACEQIFNKFESYANDLFYRNKITNINKEITNTSKLIISGEGYSYSKIRLYFLSILWRSSIATNPFFDQVKLSINDEEKIRMMLLEGDSGEEYEFPIICLLPSLVKRSFDIRDIAVTRSPIKKELMGRVIYNFLITGLTLCFIIDRSNNLHDFNSVKKDSFILNILNKEETLKQRDDRIKMIQRIL